MSSRHPRTNSSLEKICFWFEFWSISNLCRVSTKWVLHLHSRQGQKRSSWLCQQKNPKIIESKLLGASNWKVVILAAYSMELSNLLSSEPFYLAQNSVSTKNILRRASFIRSKDIWFFQIDGSLDRKHNAPEMFKLRPQFRDFNVRPNRLNCK